MIADVDVNLKKLSQKDKKISQNNSLIPSTDSIKKITLKIVNIPDVIVNYVLTTLSRWGSLLKYFRKKVIKHQFFYFFILKTPS